MTREELLEAIGRVDDDLIQEAEDCRLPARRPGLPHWRPLAGGLAACLVLARSALSALRYERRRRQHHLRRGGLSAAQELSRKSLRRNRPGQRLRLGERRGAARGALRRRREAPGGASSQEGRGPGCAAHPRGGVYPHRRDGLRTAGGQPPAGRALPGGGGQPGPAVHLTPGVRRVHAVGRGRTEPSMQASPETGMPWPGRRNSAIRPGGGTKAVSQTVENPLESDDSSGFQLVEKPLFRRIRPSVGGSSPGGGSPPRVGSNALNALRGKAFSERGEDFSDAQRRESIGIFSGCRKSP